MKINEIDKDYDVLGLQTEPYDTVGLSVPDENNSEVEFDKAETHQSIKRIIERLIKRGNLTKNEQVLLYLYFWKELDFTDIAEVLKLKPHVVKGMLKRTLSKLKQFGTETHQLALDRLSRLTKK
jgi:DNA-directed RNA polymerase specialized sigma subunit